MISKEVCSQLKPHEIESLRSLPLVNSKEINGYLKNNTDLAPFLAWVKTILDKEPEVEACQIELYRDPQEHWERIFILVETEHTDEDAIDEFEDALFTKLMSKKERLVSGRVVLSVGGTYDQLEQVASQ